MTTIGTAVLQIIPSLKGVSEAIDKQLDGKVVEVAVAPKVDKTAAKKAGQEAGKETGEAVATATKDAVKKADVGKVIADDIKTKTGSVGKEAGEKIAKDTKDAVRKSDVGKAVASDLTDSVKTSSPGKELAKVIVDGVAAGVKQEIGASGVGTVIIDELTTGVKKGIDSAGTGTQIINSITSVLKSGDLGGKIKDAVLPSITNIGTQIRSSAAEWSHDIANSLRSGDIQGATSQISTAVQNATNSISSLGGAVGLPTDGIQNFGNDVSAAVKKIGDTAGGATDQVNQVITPLQTFASLAGPDSKMFKATEQLPLIGTLITLIPIARDANAQIEGIVQKYTGLNVPLSGESWIRWLSDNGTKFNSAADNAHRALADAQAAADANRAPVQRGSAFPGDTGSGVGAGRASGGMIPGFSTVDDRIGIIRGTGAAIGLAGGEGIVNARATRNLGGAPFISWLNGFADGGVVPPDVAAAQALAGTKYSQGARTDCSGMVARVIDRTLGMPEAGLMSTKTAKEWLAARGFVPGVGGAGQISVGWYDHGPNPNDGHMAMTLSNGINAEAGGQNGVFTIGGTAAGASSPQFDQHMHLPTVYGEGPAGSSAGSAPVAGSSPVAAATGGAPAAASSAPSSSSGGGGGGSINLPSSLSGFGQFAGQQIGNQLGDPNLGKLTSAAGSFIDGQVASALDVFGIPDSPGWLKGISTLISGIRIGGGDGAALPKAAGQSGSGAPLPSDPGNMHGSRAGQAPGPTYYITARDTEDAFVKAQRVEREKAAAKLDRF